MDKSISLVHFFHSPERETGFIHFWRCKYESVPSLQTKCWNEFVWHPHLSMTTTAVLISAQILSRRDNWGLFRFSLAVWNNSFGQSIMLLSKMPAKPSQRQQKRPPGQTKALAPSLLCTSGSPLNSNWAPWVCGGCRMSWPVRREHCLCWPCTFRAPDVPVLGTLPAPVHGNQPLTLSISSALFPAALQITQLTSPSWHKLQK